MYIERPKELFQPCIIKPLDDHEGLIISIKYNKCSSEVLVRYYAGMTVIHNWFFDFEIELKEHKLKGKEFFKDY